MPLRSTRTISGLEFLELTVEIVLLGLATEHQLDTSAGVRLDALHGVASRGRLLKQGASAFGDRGRRGRAAHEATSDCSTVWRPISARRRSADARVGGTICLFRQASSLAVSSGLHLTAMTMLRRVVLKGRPRLAIPRLLPDCWKFFSHDTNSHARAVVRNLLIYLVKHAYGT